MEDDELIQWFFALFLAVSLVVVPIAVYYKRQKGEKKNLLSLKYLFKSKKHRRKHSKRHRRRTSSTS